VLVGDAEGDSVTLIVDSSGVLVALGEVLGDSVGTLGHCVPSKADGSGLGIQYIVILSHSQQTVQMLLLAGPCKAPGMSVGEMLLESEGALVIVAEGNSVTFTVDGNGGATRAWRNTGIFRLCSTT
jgi:hypothetical protein